MLKKSFVITMLLLLMVSSLAFANDGVQTFMAGGKLRTVKPLNLDYYLQHVANKTVNIKVKDSLPSYFSWRDKGGKDWMSPVRDQGSCGSCWTFGALAVMEGAVNIALDDPDFDFDFSEQFMVSCGSGSCEDGGIAEEVLATLKYTGIPDEDCYKYLAEEGNCDDACSDWRDRVVKIYDWDIIPAPSQETLKTMILDGPVVTTMRVEQAPNGDSFYSYSGGIWQGSYENCGTDPENQVNHVVAIVGWDDSNDTWIVKNSWGTDWGDNGYLHVKRGTSCVGTFSVNWLKVDVPMIPGVDANVAFCGDKTDIDIQVYPGTNPDNPLTFNLKNCGDITAPWSYATRDIKTLQWIPAVKPFEGILDPGESVEIALTINSKDKKAETFSVDLEFESLMTGTGFTLPFSIEVTTSVQPDGDDSTVDGDDDDTIDGDDMTDGDNAVDGDDTVDGDDDVGENSDIDNTNPTDGDEEASEAAADGDEAADGDDIITGSGSNCHNTGSMSHVVFLLLGLLFVLRQSAKKEEEK